MTPKTIDYSSRTIRLPGLEDDLLIWRRASGGTVEIVEIQVMSDRRLGRGTELVRRLIAALPKDIHSVWAFTRNTNAIARAFYEGTGFVLSAAVPNFYRVKTYDDGSRDEGSEVALLYIRTLLIGDP